MATEMTRAEPAVTKDGDTEIVDRYEVMFAVRTGVTILVPKLEAFDGGIETPAAFMLDADHPDDLHIAAAGRRAILKNMRKDYRDEAVARGVIMFYELEDEEVVRCTPCHMAPAAHPLS